MSIENRRSRRRNLDQLVQVFDAMTGAIIGRIGNISSDGLMLISDVAVVEDGLMQLAFTLPDGQGATTMEVGVHEQWTEPGAMPDQYWAGFRIIDIDARDLDVLRRFVDATA
jgi:hypothetical protein